MTPNGVAIVGIE